MPHSINKRTIRSWAFWYAPELGGSVVLAISTGMTFGASVALVGLAGPVLISAQEAERLINNARARRATKRAEAVAAQEERP